MYKLCGNSQTIIKGGYLVLFNFYFSVAPENASLSTNISTVPVVCASLFVNFTYFVSLLRPLTLAVDIFTLYECLPSGFSITICFMDWHLKWCCGGRKYFEVSSGEIIMEATRTCSATNACGSERKKVDNAVEYEFKCQHWRILCNTQVVNYNF